MPEKISDRIDEMCDIAYELFKDIKNIKNEVKNIEGYEAINNLADVPGELQSAEDVVKDLIDWLDSARLCALMGGV